MVLRRNQAATTVFMLRDLMGNRVSHIQPLADHRRSVWDANLDQSVDQGLDQSMDRSMDRSMDQSLDQTTPSKSELVKNG